MRLSFATATAADALAVAALRTAAADHLTTQFGRGHWSTGATEAGVLRGMQTSRVLVARRGRRLVASLRLTTKKPWAIDPKYFAPSRRPVYLLDMVVAPDLQRAGIGRRLLEQATTMARAWLADAIRLDAYDSPAGAGPFYAKGGYREVGRATYRGVPLVYFELMLSDRPDRPKWRSRV